MTLSERCFPACPSAILSGLALLACTFVPLQAAPSGDETVFESSDLRIYRALDRNGRGVLVLTNVDEAGNFFSGRRSETGASDAPELADGAPPSAGGGAAAGPPATSEACGSESVRVRVGHGDGAERPVGEGEIEVRTDETGGTTIVININNPPPSPPAAAPAVLYVPAFGGLPGPFRYPDRQPFLGYDHGIGSPSLFSGLGLNASNGFGLKPAIPCERGYDCLFGPLLERP